MLPKYFSCFLVGRVLGNCRSDGEFFTQADWNQDEADGMNHHFDGHVKVTLPGTTGKCIKRFFASTN